MPIDTTYLDADADNVLLARPALLAMAQAVNALSASGGSALVGYLPAGTGATATDVQRKMRESVSVKDFGALGDGTGRTPTDDGLDITNAAWNRYPAGSAYFDPSYTPDATITSATKAFVNTDSWDSIGCQLAAWSGVRVYFPAGTYVLTKTIQRVRLMEGMLYGESSLKTQLTYKNFATFVGRPSAVTALLHYYRVAGGPPSYIRDIGIVSTPGSIQGTGFSMQNCNQIHLNDLWISGFDNGISQDSQCTDGPYLTGIVTEFNNTAFYSVDCDAPFIYDSDFWQSAGGGLTYKAIVIAGGAHTSGDVHVSNTRFVGFNGNAVAATGSASITSCDVSGHQGGIPFQVGAFSNVSNNKLVGTFGYSGITVTDNSIVANNFLYPSAGTNHAIINVAASSCIVTGNRIIKSNTDVVADNYAILVSAGSGSIVSNNNLTDGSRAIVAQIGGGASVFGNIQNGTLDGLFVGTTASIANGVTVDFATVVVKTAWMLTVLANGNSTTFYIGSIHCNAAGGITLATVSNGNGFVVTSPAANTLRITGLITTQTYSWKLTQIA